jgi:hypothetical protein
VPVYQDRQNGPVIEDAGEFGQCIAVFFNRKFMPVSAPLFASTSYRGAKED